MGLRVLHFIRHGQYHVARHHPDHGHLTGLGRRQAATLAATYQGFPATAVHVSTLTRAQESAEPIVAALGEVPRYNRHLLREMIPAATTEQVRSMRIFRALSSNEILAALTLEPELRRFADEEFADLAGVPVERSRGYRVAELLFRAPRRDGEHHELVISHGNLIRFLVCALLGAPPENWLALDIHHASITRIAINDRGEPVLESFNETMHLPPDLVTMV